MSLTPAILTPRGCPSLLHGCHGSCGLSLLCGSPAGPTVQLLGVGPTGTCAGSGSPSGAPGPLSPSPGDGAGLWPWSSMLQGRLCLDPGGWTGKGYPDVGWPCPGKCSWAEAAGWAQGRSSPYMESTTNSHRFPNHLCASLEADDPGIRSLLLSVCICICVHTHTKTHRHTHTLNLSFFSQFCPTELGRPGRPLTVRAPSCLASPGTVPSGLSGPDPYPDLSFPLSKGAGAGRGRRGRLQSAGATLPRVSASCSCLGSAL